MRHFLLLIFVILINHASAQTGKAVLIIHGGAGTILQKDITADKEKQYRASLESALQKGYSILNNKGTAVDAVEAVIRILEDDSLFNAGKGSVFNSEGKNEMDAAIMDGTSLRAGSVASTSVIKNPVSAAKAVMLHSPHVMLSGKGADDFARKQKLEIVDPSYFRTETRYRQWLKIKSSDTTGALFTYPDYKYGTVGAVALDMNGNLAAATSTGGMTNKKYGRIGDSPLIGAGTYANSECGISCTGYGEYFIRTVAAHEVASLVEYRKESVDEAAGNVLNKIARLGGDGGMIVLDKEGNFSLKFNTEGMYRGYITKEGKSVVLIYKEK